MKKYLFITLLGLMQLQASAQEQEGRTPKFILYASAGPSLYLNNFDYFKKLVDPWSYNFSAKVMWEPRSRIAIGLKTGYRKLYDVNFPGNNGGKITLTMIPIQTAFQMKLYKGTYAHFGMGPSVFFNKISYSKGDLLNSSFLSLGDISAGFGYVKTARNKMTFGAEFEYFHAAKSDENLLSLSFVMRLPL